MILVLLGTQNNSFYRLLEEVQKCIDEDIIKNRRGKNKQKRGNNSTSWKYKI